MNILDKKWSARLIDMSHNVASWSKDQSTKVGAIITTKDGKPVSWGFNGFPAGVDDNISSRHERPEKYKWTAHAEKNAIDLAPVSNLSGCVLFVTLFPCTACARSIIQNKIDTVVVSASGSLDQVPERWRDDMLTSYEMLTEAGVTVLTADCSQI